MSQICLVYRDRLGSVHTLTSATIDASFVGGDVAVVERRAFDIFGSVIDDSEENLAGDFKVTCRGVKGHEYLQGVGVIHMNGRTYDPSLGRFLSVDPLIQSPENSQSLNPYSYIMKAKKGSEKGVGDKRISFVTDPFIWERLLVSHI